MLSEVIETIGRFFRQSTMSFKALFSWLNPKAYILIKVVNPMLQLIFFSLLARYVYRVADIMPWVIGNAFVLCTYNAFFGIGMVLAEERNFGTLMIVIASPSNKFLVFLGRAFMHIIDGGITVVIGLLTGAALFGLSFIGVDLPLFVLTLVVAMFAVSALGLLISSFGLVMRDTNLVLNVLAMMLLALSGANFPVAELPFILQKVAYLMPLTRSIEAARLIMNGGGMNIVGNLIFSEFIVGVIYMLAGYLALRVMEYYSIKNASLDII